MSVLLVIQEFFGLLRGPFVLPEKRGGGFDRLATSCMFGLQLTKTGNREKQGRSCNSGPGSEGRACP